MIGETILAGTSVRCMQAYNWRDNISLIIGLQSSSWWSVHIYCAHCWPTIGAPIIVPPILARSSAVTFNSANPTWDFAIITFGGFALPWKNFKKTNKMRPRQTICDWPDGYRRIDEIYILLYPLGQSQDSLGRAHVVFFLSFFRVMRNHQTFW